MNHRVAAIEYVVHKETAIEGTPPRGTDAQDWFFAFYLSLARQVLTTIADGDCGLDAMCLMLEGPQTLAKRERIRYECSMFAGGTR